MASRTNGFFEQHHKPAHKPQQWRQSSVSKQPLGEIDPNVARPKPSIPATSQTKSKLKAFQLIPGQPEELVRADEVVGQPSSDQSQGDEMLSVPTHTYERSSAPLATTKTPQLPHAHTFPCTPGERLPLDDLIGNFDENAKPPVEEEMSPEEQLGWMPQSSSTLTPHARRKRARSSSPSCPATSSQRQEASMFFTGNLTQGEKKTPETDVTAALWQIYGGGKDGGSALKLLDFGQLVAQASPRPLETPVKSVGGFRRWASTGNEWPTSKNKRRRTDARTSIGLWSEEAQVESGGKSRVADMVNKLQETLATQRLAQSTTKAQDREWPSSSSPLPETRDVDLHRSDGSATDNRPQLPELLQAPAVMVSAPAEPVKAKLCDASRRSQPNEAQSRYAPTVEAQDLFSDGLDVHHNIPRTMLLAPDSVMPAPLHLQNKKALPAYKRPTVNASGRQYPVKQSSLPSQAPATPKAVAELDEFGDDFELTAEDLDELASQVPLEQRSLYQIPAHPNPPPQQPFPPGLTTTTLDDDDDEFGGDDLDADAFVQAEFSATQAFAASRPSTNIPLRSK
ncbi:hypothetical protein LTR62_000468 [Meristemomyces frigidus]|uniref:Uncharacterized protein n=1 Tax=Meristemomyces frigidus TaxID=1508187 RepID=A0AAN7YSW6_9PEZI|nr:hypothetical protein LTR62_000468 [Meristemomyces frigidus]